PHSRHELPADTHFYSLQGRSKNTVHQNSRWSSTHVISVPNPDTVTVCYLRYKRVLAPTPQCKRGVSNESRHSHSVLTPDTEQALVTYSTHVSVSSPDTDYSVSIPDTNRMHV